MTRDRHVISVTTTTSAIYLLLYYLLLISYYFANLEIYCQTCFLKLRTPAQTRYQPSCRINLEILIYGASRGLSATVD